MYEVLDPTRCRYVRVQTLGWSEKVSLRVELYGYKEGNNQTTCIVFAKYTFDHSYRITFRPGQHPWYTCISG